MTFVKRLEAIVMEVCLSAVHWSGETKDSLPARCLATLSRIGKGGNSAQVVDR